MLELILMAAGGADYNRSVIVLIRLREVRAAWRLQILMVRVRNLCSLLSYVFEERASHAACTYKWQSQLSLIFAHRHARAVQLLIQI